jgi:hypothetical protein
MTHVPGVTEVDGFSGPQGHAVAGAAKVVQATGREPARIARTNLRGISYVRGRRAMARLAAHSEFVRHEGIAGSQTNRPGGMTGKAAQNVTG